MSTTQPAAPAPAVSACFMCGHPTSAVPSHVAGGGQFDAVWCARCGFHGTARRAASAPDVWAGNPDTDRAWR